MSVSKRIRVCARLREHTGSDHPLNADPGGVDLLGEFVDSLRGIFVCIRIHVSLYSWERDCGQTQRVINTVKWRTCSLFFVEFTDGTAATSLCMLQILHNQWYLYPTR